jgi:hypothetical protein
LLEDLGRERWRVERQGGAGVTEGRDLDLAGRGRRVEPGEKGNVVRNEVDRVLIRAIFGFTLKIGVVSDPFLKCSTHTTGRVNIPFMLWYKF